MGLLLSLVIEKWFKKMFPSIEDTGDFIESKNANGSINKESKYIIPKFVLTDNDSNKIIIQNLYCTISNVKGMNFHILLSCSIFYSAKLVIMPVKVEGGLIRKVFIETFINGRDTLTLQECKADNGRVIGYPALFKR